MTFEPRPAIQPMPLIVGAAGVALVFIIILLFATCGGGDEPFAVVTPDDGSGSTITPGDSTQAPGATLEPTEPTGPRIYVVTAGDSVSRICEVLLPNLALDACIEAIVRLNDLASAAQINIDQELILPGEGALPTPEPTPTIDPDAPTPVPTATPEPTATPAPTATPEPQSFSGDKNTATQPINPTGSVSVLAITHAGAGGFVVKVFADGGQLTLVNIEGPYFGSRPLETNSPFTLEIEANAEWTISISPLASGGVASVTGTGDSVSPWFDPPEDGPWDISYTGPNNFIVTLHCDGGSDLIENALGDFNATKRIVFLSGSCYWEVQASGPWSLMPG